MGNRILKCGNCHVDYTDTNRECPRCSTTFTYEEPIYKEIRQARAYLKDDLYIQMLEQLQVTCAMQLDIRKNPDKYRGLKELGID